MKTLSRQRINRVSMALVFSMAAAASQALWAQSSGSLADDLSKAAASPPPAPAETLKNLGFTEPADVVRAKLADPPNAKRIAAKSSLWVDVKNHRVFVDGYIACRDAPLEMFACPANTKEHESIVGVLAKSNEVHAALLAIGATPGTTVKFDPKYVPATGQRIRVWVMYRDPHDKFHAVDAREWVRKGETEQSLDMDWIFAGSTTWTDPADNVTYYQANSGEMICVSNFSTAMLDLPIESSDSNSQLQFVTYTKRIPPAMTPVRLMLVPIPVPSDQPADKDKSAPAPDQKPDESLLPKKS